MPLSAKQLAETRFTWLKNKIQDIPNHPHSTLIKPLLDNWTVATKIPNNRKGFVTLVTGTMITELRRRNILDEFYKELNTRLKHLPNGYTFLEWVMDSDGYKRYAVLKLL